MDNTIVLITALFGALTTLLGAATALLGVWNKRRIDQVHTMVNSQHDALEARNAQLIETLSDAKISIAKPPGKTDKTD